MKDGDSLPPIICHRCVYKLDALHNFREASRKSDVILKKYLDYAKQLSSPDELVNFFFFWSYFFSSFYTRFSFYFIYLLQCIALNIFLILHLTHMHNYTRAYCDKISASFSFLILSGIPWAHYIIYLHLSLVYALCTDFNF